MAGAWPLSTATTTTTRRFAEVARTSGLRRLWPFGAVALVVGSGGELAAVAAVAGGDVVRIELGGRGDPRRSRAIADCGSLFIFGQERRLLKPRPKCIALGAQRLQRIGVRLEAQLLPVSLAEPTRQRLGDALDEGQHGGAPEDALRLFLARLRQDRHVRVGVVAGNAEQPSCLRAFGKVVVARLRHDGGTPRASAISRAATWRADSCLAR